MMTVIKKFLVYLIIFTYLNLAACTSSIAVSKEALYAKCGRGSIGTMTISTEKMTIKLDQASCKINNDTLIVTGLNTNIPDIKRQFVTDSIAMADIKYLELEEYDSGKTLGLILGAGLVTLGVFVLVAAASLEDSFDCSKNM